MKSFHERNQVTIGMVGTAVLVAVLVVVLNVHNIPLLANTQSYQAEFSEAGGLRAGDDVEIAGTKVGSVDGIELSGKKVVVDLEVDSGANLGNETAAAIKVQTVLGRKFLDLRPAGENQLDEGDTIPLARTRSPYNLTQGLTDLTNTAQDLDVAQVARALEQTGAALGKTSPNLESSLRGMSRLSETISSRDEALGGLLRHARGLSGVLAERNQQITKLFVDGRSLLSALNGRKEIVHQLLVNVRSVTTQLTGLVKDNERQIGPALDQLNGVLDLLNANYQNLSQAITRLGPFARQLGDAVSTGPFFEAFVQNLVPSNLLPQIPALSGGDIKPPMIGNSSEGAPMQQGRGGN